MFYNVSVWQDISLHDLSAGSLPDSSQMKTYYDKLTQVCHLKFCKIFYLCMDIN